MKAAVYSGKKSICKIWGSKRYRVMIFTLGSLLFNLSYTIYNSILGILQKSVWFITMGVYYGILSIVRLIAVKGGYRQDKKDQMAKEISIMKRTGIMLFLLAFTLSGSICLSMQYGLSKEYDTITMITIATYTFSKIIMAVINLGKSRKRDTPLIITIRDISISDALVSMLSLQMSMFATFGKDEAVKSHRMNAISGACVCLCIVLTGVAMIRKANKMNKNGMEITGMS